MSGAVEAEGYDEEIRGMRSARRFLCERRYPYGMLFDVKYGCESRKEFVKALWLFVSAGVEAVADPRLGDDVAGIFGGLDLLAELADVDTEVLGLIGVGAPYGMEEGAMREDLSGVFGEDDEEVELLGG